MNPLKRTVLLKAADTGLADLPIRALERELEARGVPSRRQPGQGVVFVGKVLNKSQLIRTIATLDRRAYFAAFMQPAGYRFFPQGLWAETVPLCYDCWSPAYPRWVSLFQRMRTRLAFITSRQSAEYLDANVPGLTAIWMPEAIDPASFLPDRPLRTRSVDVLELGRRWDEYHEAITGHCAGRGIIHVYEKQKGEIVFASHQAFVAGLEDSKLSVCVPSSITHPERSGNVETLTQRYLESIAAGCLLLGIAPREMVDLFGYDPVIPIDRSDPRGQLDNILARIDEFEPMRRRNLARLHEVGTWAVRVPRLIREMAERGY